MKKLSFLTLSLFVFFAFAIVSCKTAPAAPDIDETPYGIKLEKNKVFLISKIEDGQYKDSVYGGTGKKVADYFYSFIRPNASKVIIGTQDDYLAEAKKQKVDYILRAVITNWEPRNSVASGRQTKVTILTKVINVNTGKEVIIRNLTQENAKFTAKSLGSAFGIVNTSAEEIAQSMIRELCGEIF